MTHWNHPGWFAYFPGNNSPPSILGEMLTATIGAQGMSWATSPAATELEQVVMDWLRQMLGLPAVRRRHPGHRLHRHPGGAAHRARAGDRGRLRRAAAWPPPAALTVYASAEAHSSIDKAVKLAGYGLDQLRQIPTDATTRMRPDALADAVAEDLAAGLRPGLRGRHGRDDLFHGHRSRCRPIAELCRRHGVWLHVDAAYAGTAAIVPELRHSSTAWSWPTASSSTRTSGC